MFLLHSSNSVVCLCSRLLLAEPHATIRRYIELAIEHCAEVRIFLPFDILLHREDVPFDNIDACMQQHPALTYSVLKHYLPAGLVCLPDVMAPLATFIMHNVIPLATHFRIAALAALERLAEDLARIDLAAYFGLLGALRAGKGVDAGAARCYVYKAALRTVFDLAEEAADACLCDKLGRQWRQRATPMFTRRIPPKAKGDADAPVCGVASPEERAGLTDCARIDLAVYLNLLWSVPLGVRPADLVQELLLILRELLAGEGGKDTARRDMYKAALRNADTYSCRGVEPGRIAQSMVEDAESGSRTQREERRYTPPTLRSYTPLTLRSLIVSNGHLCHTSPSAPETIIWMAPGHILVLACHTESALAMSTGDAAPVEAPRAGK
ncbi:predicted protein [Postia placenta Mad-698-R]|nr:predicted protein [Postia placenta Mad-698-R]